MTNIYERAELLPVGSATKNILGSKPIVMNEFDGIWGMNYRAEPFPDDIDEVDE